MLTDLQAGHILLRRGRGVDRLSLAPGNARLVTHEPRSTADGLVLRGLATWEPAQPDDLAQFRLALTPQEPNHD